MNRHELATLIKQDLQGSMQVKQIERVLRSAEKIIYDTVMAGGRVTMMKFGTFFLKRTAAHQKLSCLHGVKTMVDVPVRERLTFAVARKRIRSLEQKDEE